MSKDTAYLQDLRRNILTFKGGIKLRKLNFRERLYEDKNLRNVKHTTLNPYGPGSVRIHMVPPKRTLNKDVPYLVFLNGSDILPIKISWAILLSSFIDEVNFYEGSEITKDELEKIVRRTVAKVKMVYPATSSSLLKEDLKRIINSFVAIACGGEQEEEIGLISINEYAKYMEAPHRMDLMVSSMQKNGCWNCNQKCLHCYAAGQENANVEEISTSEWERIIDKCKKIGIPQLTFTGGEPTLREDLVRLISYAKWFVTRLNTNGVLLTQELCEQLYVASLDSVQVTLYSNVPEIHNELVGAENFHKTVAGIQNAIEAGLNVSINTPLCSLNKDYVSTLKFAKELGVKYVSCSGLIPSGNATKTNSTMTKLESDEMYHVLQNAVSTCKELHMEMSFTSPGWVEEEKVRDLGLSVPACGACLSNMAIAPNGDIIPCQSWLSSGSSLGNLLRDDWKEIWNSDKCKEIRNRSTTLTNICQLRDYNC